MLVWKCGESLSPKTSASKSLSLAHPGLPLHSKALSTGLRERRCGSLSPFLLIPKPGIILEENMNVQTKTNQQVPGSPFGKSVLLTETRVEQRCRWTEVVREGWRAVGLVGARHTVKGQMGMEIPDGAALVGAAGTPKEPPRLSGTWRGDAILSPWAVVAAADGQDQPWEGPATLGRKDALRTDDLVEAGGRGASHASKSTRPHRLPQPQPDADRTGRAGRGLAFLPSSQGGCSGRCCWRGVCTEERPQDVAAQPGVGSCPHRLMVARADCGS